MATEQMEDREEEQRKKLREDTHVLSCDIDVHNEAIDQEPEKLTFEFSKEFGIFRIRSTEQKEKKLSKISISLKRK